MKCEVIHRANRALMGWLAIATLSLAGIGCGSDERARSDGGEPETLDDAVDAADDTASEVGSDVGEDATSLDAAADADLEDGAPDTQPDTRDEDATQDSQPSDTVAVQDSADDVASEVAEDVADQDAASGDAHDTGSDAAPADSAIADTADSAIADTADSAIADAADSAIADAADTVIADTADTVIADTADTAIADTADTAIADTADSAIADAADSAIADAADTAIADTADTTVDAADTFEDTTPPPDTSLPPDTTTDTGVVLDCAATCIDSDPCTAERCDAAGVCHHDLYGLAAITVGFTPTPDQVVIIDADVTPAITVSGPHKSAALWLDGAPLTPGTLVTAEGPHRLAATVTACDGTLLERTQSFYVDKAAPTLSASVAPPANDHGWHRLPPTVTFTASDSGSPTTVTPPVVVDAQGAGQVIEGVATDGAGRSATTSVTIDTDFKAPAVAITAPQRNQPNDDQYVTGDANVTLEGLVGDDTLSGFDLATITSTKLATVITQEAPGAFSHALPLLPGVNTFVVSARDLAGNVGTASICVIRDIDPPTLQITWPPDGFVTDRAEQVVSGLAQDVIVGWVSEEDVAVTVNGVPAAVAGSRFSATIPLESGDNTVTAVGVDGAGHERRHTIHVRRQDPPDLRLSLIEGDDQSGSVGAELGLPLTFELTSASAQPVADKWVRVAVQVGDGELLDAGLGSETVIGPEGRTARLTTDTSGRVTIAWRLGQYAGQASNRLTAQAAGALQVTAQAHGVAGPAARVALHDGHNQNGAPERPLPLPLMVRVADAAGNPVAQMPVTFAVVRGDGKLGGQTSVTVPSNANGFADVVFSLGRELGRGAHAVEARLPGAVGEPGRTVTFSANALAPSDPMYTRVTGLVLDESERPVPGVTLRVAGTTTEAVSDDAGRFVLVGVPPGFALIEVDGEGATPPGVDWRWPAMTLEVRPVEGADNPLERPIFLARLARGVWVDGLSDVTITVPELPGFALSIPAGTRLSFPGGASAGFISVTQVPFEQAPMAPLDGIASRGLVTIQPPNVRFDPPAPLTVPNSNGYPPGRQVEIFSFDHELEAFVAVGPGQVSEDGTVIVSAPGVGVVKGGWHYIDPPGTPPGDDDDKGPGNAEKVTAKLRDVTPKEHGPARWLEAHGKPDDGAYWVIDTCGGLALEEPAAGVPVCHGKHVCPITVVPQAGIVGSGRVRAEHVSSTSSKSAKAVRGVDICGFEETSVRIEFNEIFKFVSNFAKAANAALDFGTGCEVEVEGIEATSVAAELATKCCPGCDKGIARQMTLELAVNPNISLGCAIGFNNLMPFLGKLSPLYAHVFFEVGVGLNLAGSWTVTGCCPSPPCHDFGLGVGASGSFTLGGKVGLGYKDFILGEAKLSASVGVDTKVAVDLEKICAKACMGNVVGAFDLTFLNGIKKNWSKTLWCGRELFAQCDDFRLPFGDGGDIGMCSTDSTCQGEEGFEPPEPPEDAARVLTNACSSDANCQPPPPEPKCFDSDCPDDGDPCNGQVICEPSIGCIVIPPPECKDDHLSCTRDYCKEGVGCVHEPLDPDPCARTHPCATFVCDPGTVVSGDGCVARLDDFKCREDSRYRPCHNEACWEDEGCTFTPTHELCRWVDSPAGCQDYACDPEDAGARASGCVFTSQDARCDDGQACTTEACAPDEAGANEQGCVITPRDESCEDDPWECTKKRCDPQQGCMHDPDDTTCDDQASCTDDSCDPQSVQADARGCRNHKRDEACNDYQACTSDRCDPSASDLATGCAFTPDHAQCEDQVSCTLDTCTAFSGCSNTPDNAVCDDGLSCTSDSCDAQSDCQYVHTGTGCGDGCIDGNCADDGDQCTKAVCVQNTWCDHQPLCEPGQTCTAGVCSGGE